MLALPAVTLCAVATDAPALALRALRICSAHARFGKILLFTEARPFLGDTDDMSVVNIGRFQSVRDYSHFMLRRLSPYVKTSHVLIAQWDGYVVNPAAWSPAFLEYDYIGAPWPQFAREQSVGNGGFSLRSHRLLEALSDPQIQVTHPEDLCICHVNRELLERRYDIRFAPPEVAERFSFERTRPNGPTFGFHGFFNFAELMAPDELCSFIGEMPPSMTRNRDAHDLALALLRRGDRDSLRAAGMLIRRRFAAGVKDRRQLQLALRWWSKRAARS